MKTINNIYILLTVILIAAGCSVVSSDNAAPQVETARVSGITDSLEVRYTSTVDGRTDWLNWKGEASDLTVLTDKDTPAELIFEANGVNDAQVVIVNRSSQPVDVGAGLYNAESEEISFRRKTLQTGKALLVKN